MLKVNFKYNIKKDAWSWVYIAQGEKNKWGMDFQKRVAPIPQNILEKILKTDKKSAELLVYKYLTLNFKRKMHQLVIDKQLKALDEIWKKIGSKYFKRLEKITQKPIFWKDFGCYLTTGNMCPYNPKEKWFMVSMWHSICASITAICHEIFHLQFLHYYGDYCRKFLSEQQKEDLKEAITFILNTDFNDLLICKDNGYPNHQELRKKLKSIWLKNKNFKRFLDKAIKMTKKYGKNN
jgi:hypothetical protein